jgi:hypothetical protein
MNEIEIEDRHLDKRWRSRIETSILDLDPCNEIYLVLDADPYPNL